MEGPTADLNHLRDMLRALRALKIALTNCKSISYPLPPAASYTGYVTSDDITKSLTLPNP